MDEKKCIAILVPHGWTIKNLLLNDFYNFLTENSKVLIFSPLSSSENFQGKFKKNNVLFYDLLVPKLNSLQRNFYDILHYSQYFRKKTHLNQSFLKLYPIKSWKGKFLRNLKRFFAKYLGKYISMDFQIFLEKYFLSFKEEVNRIKEIYKLNNVNLVFSTMPLISLYEHPALFAAKELNIKTACIITSWDNLASKGRLPIRFEHYFCWSNLMKKELREWYPFIKEEQITVSGPPQFDYYFKKEFLMDKEAFFKKIGADKNKKIILWAASSENQYPNEDKIFESFYLKIKNNVLFENCQVVLRAHPIGGLLRFKEVLKKYKEIIPMETNPDDPKYLIKWNPSLEDIKDLVNIIYYSDVIINHCSTFTLDAFALDKPVINLAYDLEKNSKIEKYVVNCYKYDHYTCVLEYNSVKLAYSEEELIRYINWYLEDPSRDREERKKLFDLQIGNKNGDASLIIARKLLEIL